MKRTGLTRRDFTRLTSAALGGIMAGTVAGCGSNDDDEAPVETGGPHLLVEGKNVCRGMNHTCANHRGGENACAGQGVCATADRHDCHGENGCKGQGGCGETPGQNGCKGQGECAVPLGKEAWKKARAAFEKAMSDAGKKFGPAPEPISG